MTTREMTLRQYLRIHPDYRTVQAVPRRCMYLERDEAGATVLRPVRIIEDIRATLEAETAEGYLVVEAQTSSLGEQAPYFSLTGTLYKSKRGAHARSDSSYLSGGCLHEEILAAFPNLAPIEALHLADAITGEPMHAAANGWFHYSGRRWNGEHEAPDMAAAARALRVDVDELPAEADEEAFLAWTETLRERWAAEAEQGRRLLSDLAPAPRPPASPDGNLFEHDQT